MSAKTFKCHVAQVKRPSRSFEGYTTLVRFDDGREIAVFAPSKKLLLKALRSTFPFVEIDPKRFQNVAYFDAKRLSNKRRSSLTSSANPEKP
jgi:hypothetical protein